MSGRARRPAAWAALGVLALGVLLGLPQGAADREVRMTASGAGFDAHFTAEGFEGLDPTIPVLPGENVTFRVQVGAPGGHNLFVGGPLNQHQECCFPTGAQFAMTVRIPEDATDYIEYSCQMHSAYGMYGYLELPGGLEAPAKQPPEPTPETTPGDGEEEHGDPSPSSALVALAVAGAAVAVRPRPKA